MAKKYIEGKAAPLKKNQVRVQSGDSLWKLAEKYTGSGSNWSQLNGGKKLIKPGDVIDIPDKMWNPEVEIDGKKLRYISDEYRDTYNKTQDPDGKARQAKKDYLAGESKKGGDAARKATTTFAKDVSQQKLIPSASDFTFTKGQQSVNKYFPAVPAGEERENSYYPEIVGGKATYKPIQYRKDGGSIDWIAEYKCGGKAMKKKIKKAQEGDKMGNGKDLKSGFKKTTYELESKRLKAENDSLSSLPNASKMKIQAKIARNKESQADLEASKTKKVYIQKKNN